MLDFSPEKIVTLMRVLDVTREEAIEIIKEDDRIDRMTSLKEVDNDLTPEKRKTIKQFRSTGTRRVNAYGKSTMVNRKPKEDLRLLIQAFTNLLENIENVTEIEVINPEHQITFKYLGKKKRIMLSNVTKEGKK